MKLKDSVSIEPIIKIEYVIDEGIYAPETEDGNIVVNDVVASCYTDIDQDSLFDTLLKVNFYVQSIFAILAIKFATAYFRLDTSCRTTA